MVADDRGPRRRADPRLPAYLIAGFAPLFVAIATGQPNLAALGAPFLVLSALGLVDIRPPSIRADVALDAGRAVEGDVFHGRASVEWDGEAEVEVLLDGLRGVTPEDPGPVPAWALGLRAGPVTLPFRLRARSWGEHDLGSLWVRLHRPGSFVIWEQRVATVPTVQVLPRALRLGRLLKPTEPRVVAGMHLARFRGHGSDFAELRPYRPGDRMRDLSWGTSARLGVPWVRVNHPERTGTVVLLLDTMFGGEDEGKEVLARAARATWAVASAHLRAQDRVGLLGRGLTAAWLPPGGGRHARHMLLEELLSVGKAAEDLSWRRAPGRRISIPADALIVGVTSLRGDTFAPRLLHYRRTGHATVALVVDTTDLLPEAGGAVDRTARRLRLARREVDRLALARAGIPTALVTAADGVGPAVLALRRKMNAFRHITRMPGR